MIALVTDNPSVRGTVKRDDDGRFVYSLRLAFGKHDIETEWRPYPVEAGPNVIDGFQRLEAVKRALDEVNSKAERFMAGAPSGPGNFDAYQEERTELGREIELVVERCKAELASVNSMLTSEMIPLLRESDLVHQMSSGAVRFAYCKGRVWSSRIALEDAQWLALVKRALDRERSALSRLTSPAEGSEPTRLISTEVRREVWRRDRGQCTECRSQERLEFDHIIPVALGGSNSVRNIQLLCEVCNRKKAATLG